MTDEQTDERDHCCMMSAGGYACLCHRAEYDKKLLADALTAALDEIKRLETRIRSLDHALNFILSDAAWTPKHPACESIIHRINALRKGSDE